MDRRHRCTTRRPRPTIGRLALFGAAPLLLAVALVPPCRADSTLLTASPTSGPLTASAHLDFRVTVLPSLALSTQATGVRIQGNSGVLTVQRSPSDAWDGRAPTGSAQLRPRHQVIDTSMHTSDFAGSDLITIASP